MAWFQLLEQKRPWPLVGVFGNCWITKGAGIHVRHFTPSGKVGVPFVIPHPSDCHRIQKCTLSHRNEIVFTTNLCEICIWAETGSKQWENIETIHTTRSIGWDYETGSLADGRIVLKSSSMTIQIYAKNHLANKWGHQATLTTKDNEGFVKYFVTAADWVAIADDNRILSIWQENTSRNGQWALVFTYALDPADVRSMVVIADNCFAAGFHDGSLCIFVRNPNTRIWVMQCKLVAYMNGAAVTGLCKVTSGQILSISSKNTVKSWEVNRDGLWRVSYVLRVNSVFPNEVAAFPDGKIMIHEEDAILRVMVSAQSFRPFVGLFVLTTIR